jgi:ferredoxin
MSERKVGELTVRIERDLCIGSGNCVKIAPELFELDSDGLVAFRDGSAEEDRERTVDACQVCPVEALLVRDAKGDQIVP